MSSDTNEASKKRPKIGYHKVDESFIPIDLRTQLDFELTIFTMVRDEEERLAKLKAESA
jgi:hypothetical protein